MRHLKLFCVLTDIRENKYKTCSESAFQIRPLSRIGLLKKFRRHLNVVQLQISELQNVEYKRHLGSQHLIRDRACLGPR
jgi:hypothetical protein